MIMAKSKEKLFNFGDYSVNNADTAMVIVSNMKSGMSEVRLVCESVKDILILLGTLVDEVKNKIAAIDGMDEEEAKKVVLAVLTSVVHSWKNGGMKDESNH
jgi:urea transporter